MLSRFRPALSSFSAVASVAVVAPFIAALPTPAPATGSSSPAIQEPVTAASGPAELVSPVRADPVTPRVREVPVPDVDRSGSPRLAAVSAPQ
ncbi:MAG: hypothetical protein ACRDOZ_15205, partial [Nocardioides sp.]